MSDRDRMKRALLNLIRGETERFNYFALYPCTVVAQKGDGTLDLRPDDAKHVAAPTGVKMHGLPGFELKVRAGARVLLGFHGGDPRKPYAALFELEGLLELAIAAGVKVTISAPTVEVTGETKVTVSAPTVEVSASVTATVNAPVIRLADGAQPIARVGDTVTCTGTAGPFPAVVTGVIASGNGKVLA